MTAHVPRSVSSLVDLFIWRCGQNPQGPAYGFVRDTLELDDQVTYGELARQVGSLAQVLARRAQPGERVLLLFNPGLDVVRAFWACLCAGLVPVPAPAPDPIRRKHSEPRLRAIAADIQASLVVTTTHVQEMSVELPVTPDGRPVEWVAVDGLPDDDGKITLRECTAESLAYLQYTSGSTAVPRGVMISHGNVLAQCEGIVTSMGVVEQSRSLCWLPYFHDYGLVHGIIAPFYAGVPAYLMSPLTFLRRPLRWLDAIGRLAITHSGAPNFAYESCVKALQKHAGWKGDLRRWVVASCGAEPIHAQTIEQFCHVFAPYGFLRRSFTPAYGLAEATLVVSSKPPDDDPLLMAVSSEALKAHRVRPMSFQENDARVLVGCGQPFREMQVTIVHPTTQEECRSDEVGEIWVSGPSVAQGYWRRPDDSSETFRADCGGKKDGPYLRTGDVGFLSCGQVFITGRLKDLIILNGRNLYPHDLELAVEGCHPALGQGGCVAFSVEEQNAERLVFVQELERSQGVDHEDIATAIRVTLAERYEVPVWTVVLVRSGTIPKTSSGKLQRQACRKAFLERSLPTLVASVASTAVADVEQGSEVPHSSAHGSLPDGERNVKSYLVQVFAEQTGLPVARVNASAPLVSLGLDSLAMSLIKNRLEQELGVSLTFSQLFSQWTIHDLATYIAGVMSSESNVDRVAGVESSGRLTREMSDQTIGRRTSDGDRHALSSAQERLWFLEQMQPGSALNHISLGMRLSGRFDAATFKTSVEEIARRHDMLRARFGSDENRAYYRVAREGMVAVRHYSLRGMSESVQDEETRRWMREEALVPFDLGREGLLRVLLLERADDDQVLVLTVHRLIADGWSLRLLCKELTALYNAGGRADDLRHPSPCLQYQDYAQWQQDWLDEAKCEGQLSYWRRLLDRLPPLPDLPTDRPRPRVRQFQGGARSRALPHELAQLLGVFCQRQGVTKFMVVHAVFAAWLQRVAGTSDVVVGSVLANRRLAKWENVFGYFANTVALRTNLSEIHTVGELMARSRQVVAEAYDHQDVPFERVIGSLNVPRDATTFPVFNVMVVLEDDPLSDLKLHDVAARHLPIADMAAEFDLTLLIVNDPSGLELVMLYDAALFDGSTADRMLGQLETLLRGMIEAPPARLSELPLLTAEERQRVLVDWNNTAAEAPFSVCVPHVIDVQTELKPDAAAVICGELHLSYRDLHAQADHVARAICRLGEGGNVRVGLCVERSVLGLVGLLGILKAGAAYVPLDAGAPEPRQRLLLEDSGVSLVVTQRHLRARLPDYEGSFIELETLVENSAGEVGTTPMPTLNLDDLAYVIYTSGSTGRPKGVEVTHRALAHSLAARLTYYPDPVQRCLLTFPLTFDGSITGIFWTLMQGGTVIIPSEDGYRDPRQLAALIQRHAISHVVWTPSLYDVILRDSAPGDLASLCVVVSAGEGLPHDVVRRHYERLPHATLYNEYGPTEAAVWSSVYRASAEDHGPLIPIGKPIANTAMYMLDSEMRPVPIGVTGEICIGGGGLARGYLKQPELTDAKFVANPYAPGARLYKTGDFGRFRPDGNIEFVGRVDQQVKLRGYRIELGEVEAALRDLPGIRDAVVIMYDDPVKGPMLAGYATSDQRPAPTAHHLQELMGRRVPSYMVPSTVVVMDSLPLLPNGKVDRQALPDPSTLSNTEDSATVHPRDHIDHTLIEIWSQVLGRRRIGIHQNFFALGGHSLLATQAVSRIREVFRVELPLRALFESPTIFGVAEQIRVERRRTDGQRPLPPIVPVARTQSLPLSYSQQRMWFVQRLAPEATAYNLLFVSRQKGPLKTSALREAIDALTRRHESLRTTFTLTGAGLVQIIASWQAPHWLEVDLRRLPEDQREQEAVRLAEEEGRRPFDLQRGPLARFCLIRIGDGDHLFVINLHHIIGDQWSFGILGRDFAMYYNALAQGQPLPDVPLPIQYADYAVWQRRCLTEDRLKSQEEYWVNRLAGLSALSLPTDYPRPATQTFRGAYCWIDLPDALIEQLKSYSSRRQVTAFMTLLACFQLLLSRYSGQTDLAVGSPIANRTHMALEQLVGTFVNTLVLRTDLTGDPTFDETLDRVKETALGAYANQDYPFDKLVDTLQIDRDPSVPHLVQVLFNMANAPIGDITVQGLTWSPFEVDPGSSQFDLSLAIELEIAKKAYLTFNTDLFSRQTAQRMLRHFAILLQQALAHSHANVSMLEILTPDEQHQLVHEWNRSESAYPKTLCLPELFEAQVEQRPDSAAVSMDGQGLTYRQLNIRANQLARRLRAMGVGPEVVVGICLDRSFDSLVALLGVMKAGGCYLPLDPEYPRERIRFMVEDAGAAVVISTAALSDRFDPTACRVLLLEQEQESLRREADHNLPPAASSQDLVYLLYTSGSTGRPKGVEIRHQSLVNFLWSMKDKPGCSAKDIVLGLTTFSFDIAGLELYLPLVVGARIELVSRAVAMDGHRLKECLERVRPTLMQATPATWRLLLDTGWTGSRTLTALCGGEGLSRDLAEQLLQRTAAVWNMYGPTETTIWSTVEQVQVGDKDMTIGRPIANTEIYILDQQMRVVPIGVPGELYIGGHGLARGYHRRPELTRERFVSHPFSKDPQAKLYRTGDLARYRSNGRIEHLGRLDHQVKVRGFRIELGEIEEILGRHPALRQVAVTAREDRHGLKQLAAYLVRREGQECTGTQLRSFLRAALPDYMVPSFFVFLDALPLTANKKVDVKALPSPSDSEDLRPQAIVLPRTKIEVQLTALWQQVLEIQDLGIHDNFFDRGGHSLKAAQLFYLLEHVFGRTLPLATLFQVPTIAELAEVLTRSHWIPPWHSLVAIQPTGSQVPFFIVPGVGGNVLVFAQLGRLLGPDQPLYGLQARGLDGKERPFTSVSEMARHYVEEMRSIRAHGPYVVGGACTGGLIAYEIAQQLTAQKESVVLIMMDSWHPSSYCRYRNTWLMGLGLPLFTGMKVWDNVKLLLRAPVEDWTSIVKQKLRTLRALLQGAATENNPETRFQIERVSQATFHAVARYDVREYSGRLLNVIASRRSVGDHTADTRSVWEHWARDGADTVHIPAEDSGLLFAPPHVEETAKALQQYLASHKLLAPMSHETILSG